MPKEFRQLLGFLADEDIVPDMMVGYDCCSVCFFIYRGHPESRHGIPSDNGLTCPSCGILKKGHTQELLYR